MTRAINGVIPPMWHVGNLTVKGFPTVLLPSAPGVINSRSTFGVPGGNGSNELTHLYSSRDLRQKLQTHR